MIKDIEQILGAEAESLLTYQCKTVPKEMLHLPGPDFIDRVMVLTDRRPQVLRNLGAMFNHGRLSGTGYLSILPVDQGGISNAQQWQQNTLEPSLIFMAEAWTLCSLIMKVRSRKAPFATNMLLHATGFTTT